MNKKKSFSWTESGDNKNWWGSRMALTCAKGIVLYSADISCCT
jgi:hypothetical protein